MAKHGWKPGQGLGANNEGIIEPLSVEIAPRNKRSKAQGGRRQGPLIGRIVGGQRAKEDGPGKFGKMSEVAVLTGMIPAGMDTGKELREGDLMMEIGRAAEKVSYLELTCLVDGEWTERN